ncbi:MAG TPA: DUF4940 domain-containing protein [Fervidobacterium sp.]|nr:DUF4940 domain-containing protein [Fervidobacterium sp.]HOM74034.1 DUF4940 domain-containing protein [Fervidobacterium sp.]HOQ38930.1 DUF4940 domain-containing protein [Fervidobacterium sp.]HPP17757.1 DUF4940 domain-containing protein [Fervidobacterium sp.]HPT53526.1 DUF4940 domain-containing protein [Fervidobacterium sp.]
MRIYTDLNDVEAEKKVYADIASSSNVRVNFVFDGTEYTFIPYKLGDITVLVEIRDEKEIIDNLLENYIIEHVVKQNNYPEEIKDLARHFKTEMKRFKILVVKYTTVEEKEFSRYSLSNVTFGIVACENMDVHLIPANMKVKTKKGYSVSSEVKLPEEGIRQALLIAKWFDGGAYEELPSLAFSKSIEQNLLRSFLNTWSRFIKYLISSTAESVEKSYLPMIVKKLNEFRTETYFDPVKDIERVALGIIIARSEGGGAFESDSYDIF